jgi:large subunit ribosomal protein L54
VTAQETTATNPRPHDKPAATSTSAAQPFSAGLHSDVAVVPKKTKPAAKVVSSVPAGTVLKGLNFMKTKQDPVALADHEYPPWLWTVLEQRDGVAGATDDAEGDLFCECRPFFFSFLHPLDRLGSRADPRSKIEEATTDSGQGFAEAALAESGFVGA